MKATRLSFMASIGEVMTRDRVSRIDPYVEWVRNPLAVLIFAMFASILCGLYLHPRALILAAGLAGVIGVGAAWPWFSVRGLEGSLHFGRERVREGDEVVARLTVRNRMPWAAWGLFVRGVTPSGGPEIVSGMAHAAGWTVSESRWSMIAERRGEYPGTAPMIVTAFPFGLWEASKPLHVPTRLLVWPRTFPDGPIPEAASGREGDGLARRNRAGTAGDPLGVRAYRRGDSLRRIHWPQSARHGRLIVCELESSATPRIRIVLDVAPDAHAGSGIDGSLEWAIRVAASFAEGWIGDGAEVEVIYGGRTVVAAFGSVSARRTLILDALARVGSDDGTALDVVLGSPACRRFDEGLRIIVSTTIGVRNVVGRTGRNRAERYVILDADAFSHSPRHRVSTVSTLRPRIVIDDPAAAPLAVRRGWKEVCVDR